MQCSVLLNPELEHLQAIINPVIEIIKTASIDDTAVLIAIKYSTSVLSKAVTNDITLLPMLMDDLKRLTTYSQLCLELGQFCAKYRYLSNNHDKIYKSIIKEVQNANSEISKHLLKLRANSPDRLSNTIESPSIQDLPRRSSKEKLMAQRVNKDEQPHEHRDSRDAITHSKDERVKKYNTDSRPRSEKGNWAKRKFDESFQPRHKSQYTNEAKKPRTEASLPTSERAELASEFKKDKELGTPYLNAEKVMSVSIYKTNRAKWERSLIPGSFLHDYWTSLQNRFENKHCDVHIRSSEKGPMRIVEGFQKEFEGRINFKEKEVVQEKKSLQRSSKMDIALLQ